MPFEQRGARLDDHLDAWKELWRQSPASFDGRVTSFRDVYVEPKPFRAEGPAIWIGGDHRLPAVARRLAAHGHGYHPLGQPGVDELDALWRRVRAADGDPGTLELIGGVRPRFPDDHCPADVDEALESVAGQVARGYTSICIKPSQYLDDLAALRSWCARVIRRVDHLIG